MRAGLPPCEHIWDDEESYIGPSGFMVWICGECGAGTTDLRDKYGNPVVLMQPVVMMLLPEVQQACDDHEWSKWGLAGLGSLTRMCAKCGTQEAQIPPSPELYYEELMLGPIATVRVAD